MVNEIKNSEDLNAFFESEEYKNFKKFYEGKSIIDIAQLVEKEEFHTKMINWIFNNDKSKVKNRLVRSLIDLALEFDRNKIGKNTKSIIQNNDKIEVLETYMEKVISCEKEKRNRRLDLMIETKVNEKDFCIIIENKINSFENDNQTEDYDKWSENRNRILIYLVPFVTKEPSSKNFIVVTYTDFLNEVIYKEYEKKDSFSDEDKKIIEEYLKIFTNKNFDFKVVTKLEINNFDNTIGKKYNFDRISLEEVKKIDNYEYKKYIRNIISILYEKNKKDKDNIYNKLYNTNGIFENKKEPYYKIVCRELEKFIKKHNSISANEINRALKVGETNIPLVVLKDEIDANNYRKYFVRTKNDFTEDIIINGKKYCICLSWYGYEVDELMEKMNDIKR